MIYPFSNLYQLSEGNIVFARTGASVGKSYMYNPKDGELVFAGFLIKVEPNIQLLYPNYLKFIVQTKHIGIDIRKFDEKRPTWN